MIDKSPVDRDAVEPKQEERRADDENRQTFERPTLRRLGALPRVTTAFGGSFTP